MEIKEIIIAIVVITMLLTIAITLIKKKSRNLNELGLEIDAFIFKISSKWSLNAKEKNKLEKEEKKLKSKEKEEDREKLLSEYKGIIERYKNLLASEHELTHQTIAKCKESSTIIKSIRKQKNRTNIYLVGQLMKELEKISNENPGNFLFLEKELKRKARKFLKEYEEILLKRIDEELSKERINKLP
jgi:hypothetical protein